MTFLYENQALLDLKKLESLQAHMLLDMFESKYHDARPLDVGLVFKTGPFRILFVKSDTIITVLRVIK